MKFNFVSIGTTIILKSDWNFDLMEEYRNRSMYSLIGHTPLSSWGRLLKTSLPQGTVLKVDRIYIRKGAEDYNSISFVVKKLPFPRKGKLRFWVKLKDANNIDFDFYEC